MLLRRVLFVVILACILAGTASATVPSVISYQGKLMQPNGTPITDGTYSVKFAIYDAPTGGEPLWSETNSSVQVKGGLFAVLLGSVNNLGANILDSQNRYLGIKVREDAELSPRQRIASVATALRAGEADVAKTVPDGAISTNKIASDAVNTAKIADGAITTSKLAENCVTRAWELNVNQDMTYQDSYVLHSMPGTSQTVITTGGPILVLVHLDAHRTNSVPSGHTRVEVKVDGTSVDGQWASEFTGNAFSHVAIPITRMVFDLPAGNHTVELWSEHVGNPGSTWRYQGYVQCIELRR